MIVRSTNIRAALRARQRGFLLNPFRFGGGGGGGDPYFDKVSLLLHMNGADGSTAFPDSSLVPKAIGVTAPVSISTARSKFGGASALFNGGRLFCSTVPSLYPKFADDFTVECFIYPTVSSSTVMRIAGFSAGVGGNETWTLNVESGGAVGFNIYDTFWRSAKSAPGSLPLNQWAHVAGIKHGSTVMVFLNGVLGATAATLLSEPVAPNPN
ncbi:LamG domain-containing protein, partial [Comamonas thiooxydans]|uniref:LamG domain-containing protein n=1 Tax=Comamonas thiooxydans TaxID=363952 RepID=UPI0013D90166